MSLLDIFKFQNGQEARPRPQQRGHVVLRSVSKTFGHNGHAHPLAKAAVGKKVSAPPAQPAPTSTSSPAQSAPPTHAGAGTGAALQDISLTAKPGEFVVVVGPSGCGKSTLLNLVAGMLRPDAGTITLDDQPVTRPGPDRAVVFQDHGLFPWLTAEQNVGFGLKMAGVADSQRQDRVAQALAMVHLGHSGRKLVHELSGGMKQRVAIARALVMDPAVLLMDEPFAALDAQTRTLMHAQLQELWSQTHKTILFVTHSVGEAVRLADRIVVLHAMPGRVRKTINVDLAHPRDFDSKDITELVQQVRREIEDEVNRVNSQMAEFWKPVGGADLGRATVGMGDGI